MIILNLLEYCTLSNFWALLGIIAIGILFCYHLIVSSENKWNDMLTNDKKLDELHKLKR